MVAEVFLRILRILQPRSPELEELHTRFGGRYRTEFVLQARMMSISRSTSIRRPLPTQDRTKVCVVRQQRWRLIRLWLVLVNGALLAVMEQALSQMMQILPQRLPVPRAPRMCCAGRFQMGLCARQALMM